MELLLFACVLVLAAGSAVAVHGSATDLNTTSKFVEVIRTGDSVIHYMPAVFYFGVEAEGKHKKQIKRCLVENPDNCEVFHEGFGANHILVHMEYVYIAKWGGIARCESYRKQSCSYIHETSDVYSLTVGGEHLYAGLKNGSVLACNLQQPYSWRTLHKFTNRTVWSLQATDKFIYSGLDNGHLMRCSVNVESESCTLSYNMGLKITCLTIHENAFFAISYKQGHLWKCSDESDAAFRCESGAMNIPDPISIASFNGSLYIIKSQKDEGLYICNWSSNPKCRNYGHHKTYFSIAFAYGTHRDVQQRSKFEVHVKDGRLFDAAGSLVDTTSKAGENKLPAPAIFVMTPSGRILLKYYDYLEPESTWSLSAGSPVSGAGEMVVEQGVIKKITACSRQYLPVLKLNKQVVDSLRSQGYTEPIVLEKCRQDTVTQYQVQ